MIDSHFRSVRVLERNLGVIGFAIGRTSEKLFLLGVLLQVLNPISANLHRTSLVLTFSLHYTPLFIFCPFGVVICHILHFMLSLL